jgi:hypothetical protein
MNSEVAHTRQTNPAHRLLLALRLPSETRSATHLRRLSKLQNKKGSELYDISN